MNEKEHLFGALLLVHTNHNLRVGEGVASLLIWLRKAL
jgi:hypothetical protein